jgi:hypothetical protein
MPTYAGEATFGGACGRVRGPGGEPRAAEARLCDDDYATDKRDGRCDGEFLDAGTSRCAEGATQRRWLRRVPVGSSGRDVPRWSLCLQRVFTTCTLHPTSRSSELRV